VIADGEAHSLAEAGEVHCFHDVVAVAFDGTGGDVDRGRDFFADFSGGEELNDFEFAGGVRTAGKGMIGAGFALALLVDEAFDHGHGEAPGEERLVLPNVTHSRDEFGVGV